MGGAEEEEDYERDVESKLLKEMGFPRPANAVPGIDCFHRELRELLTRLEEYDRDTSDVLMLKGIATQAYSHAERLLSSLVYFYGQLVYRADKTGRIDDTRLNHPEIGSYLRQVLPSRPEGQLKRQIGYAATGKAALGPSIHVLDRLLEYARARGYEQEFRRTLGKGLPTDGDIGMLKELPRMRNPKVHDGPISCDGVRDSLLHLNRVFESMRDFLPDSIVVTHMSVFPGESISWCAGESGEAFPIVSPNIDFCPDICFHFRADRRSQTVCSRYVLVPVKRDLPAFLDRLPKTSGTGCAV